MGLCLKTDTHMKRLILATTLLTLLLAACGNSAERQVKRNAREYIEALARYDMDAAEPYASKQTREKALPLLRMITQMADTAYMNANQPAKIDITDLRIDDSTAKVYYHKHTPVSDFDDSVKLVLEDGQWLVDVRLTPPPFVNMDSNIHHVKRLPLEKK